MTPILSQNIFRRRVKRLGRDIGYALGHDKQHAEMYANGLVKLWYSHDGMPNNVFEFLQSMDKPARKARRERLFLRKAIHSPRKFWRQFA